jgi:hypothetical protein
MPELAALRTRNALVVQFRGDCAQAQAAFASAPDRLRNFGWYSRSPPAPTLPPEFVVLLQLSFRDPPVLEASSHCQRRCD